MTMNQQNQSREADIHHEYGLSIIHSLGRSVQRHPNGVANTKPPNSELNLTKGYGEINNDVSHFRIIPDRRTFACYFCTKQFKNGQALGGHQRAHTLERAFQNWQQIRFRSLQLSPTVMFYNRFGVRELFGSCYGDGVPLRNPLGVNALSSMIHKPVGSVVSAAGYRARGFGRSFPVTPGPILRPWTYSQMINPINNNGASSSSNQEIIDLMAHDGAYGTPLELHPVNSSRVDTAKPNMREF